MQVAPGSTINLYSNIKIRKGMGPGFSTPAKRNTYFSQHLVRANVNTTYVRHSGEVKIEAPLSLVKTCNYISFINPDFENMTWYALLVDWEYVNNECTRIDYIIDPLMTYMFQFEMHECMLSRQHLSISDYDKAAVNPYDPTIYQFTTSEDLAVGPELEKPEYNIKRFNGDSGPDGTYMLTSSIQDSNAYSYDMGQHVMGVIFMAPLSLEKLDEGSDAWDLTEDGENFVAAINTQIHQEFVDHGSAFTPEQGVTAYRANRSQWTAIVAGLVQWMVQTQSTYNTPQDISTAIGDALVAAAPADSPGAYIFEEGAKEAVRRGIVSVSDAPSAQWLNLMQTIIDAGGAIFNSNDPYLSTNNAGIGKLPWSAFVRAYNIIAVPGMLTPGGLTLFNDVIEKLTTWDSVSQIIGIYAINDNVFYTAFVDGNGIVPSPADIASDNIYTLPTSFARIGQGQEAVDSKKLLTFPFSYMRVTTPDGNVKEYRYEWFNDVTAVQSSARVCKFRVMGDLNSHPSIMMAPIKYRRFSPGYIEDGQVMDAAMNVNLDEMVIYDEFAQVPFMTDAYLTYLAGQVMRIHGQNTMDYQDELNLQEMAAKTGVANSIWGSVKTLFGGDLHVDTEKSYDNRNIKNTSTIMNPQQVVSAGVGRGVGVAMSGANSSIAYQQATFEKKHFEGQLADAREYLSGSVNGDIDWPRYNNTKPAHANNVYHPGTNGGIYHYLRGLAVTDFIVTYVQLKPSVLEKYDRYFKLFGYNEAARADIPYIYNFLHQDRPNVGDDILPHWDEDADGDYVTYIQTMDAHVTGIPLPYANYIEMLFNSGYRFINGDRLIS